MKAWYWALFPEEMALGFFSVLLPLYLVSDLNGTLIEVSAVAAITSFSSIPASIFWGNLTDRTGKCKQVLSFSLILVSATFFLMAGASNIYELLILSMLFGISRPACPSATSILIAESNSKDDWSKEIARSRFILRLGNIVGLIISILLVATYGYQGLFMVCGFLVFVSFVLSLILIQNPPISIERRLVVVERMISFVEKASYVVCYGNRMSQSFIRKFLGKGSSPVLFSAGVFTYAFAAEIVFTTLAVYFYQRANLPSDLVSMLFLVNSVGSLIGFVLIDEWVESGGGSNGIKIAALSRAFLLPSLLVCAYLPYVASIAAAAIIMTLIGFFWAVFSISSSLLCMNIIPEGKLGFYSGVVELGGTLGMIAGGFIPTFYGFELLFIISGVLFAISFIIFKLGLGEK